MFPVPAHDPRKHGTQILHKPTPRSVFLCPCFTRAPRSITISSTIISKSSLGGLTHAPSRSPLPPGLRHPHPRPARRQKIRRQSPRLSRRAGSLLPARQVSQADDAAVGG